MTKSKPVKMVVKVRVRIRQPNFVYTVVLQCGLIVAFQHQSKLMLSNSARSRFFQNTAFFKCDI
jgi:hypothetical protein